MKGEKWPSLEGISIGQYRIDKFLGEGAYGKTYKATNTKLDTDVAIKILKIPVDDKIWIEEAKKAAQIKNCQYVVRPLDFDKEKIKIDFFLSPQNCNLQL